TLAPSNARNTCGRSQTTLSNLTDGPFHSRTRSAQSINTSAVQERGAYAASPFAGPQLEISPPFSVWFVEDLRWSGNTLFSPGGVRGLKHFRLQSGDLADSVSNARERFQGKMSAAGIWRRPGCGVNLHERNLCAVLLQFAQ